MRRGTKAAVVVLAALTFGVAAAWAGLPNLKTYDATFDSGSTGGGKKSSTTLAAGDLLTAAATGEARDPSFTVNYSGTAFRVGDEVRASIAAYVSWACFNNGSNVPADGNGQKSALAPAALTDGVSIDAVGRNGRAAGDIVITIATPSAAAVGLACQGTQRVGLYSLRLATAAELVSGVFTDHEIPATIEIWAVSTEGAGDHQAVTPPANLPYCADPAGLSACFPAG